MASVQSQVRSTLAPILTCAMLAFTGCTKSADPDALTEANFISVDPHADTNVSLDPVRRLIGRQFIVEHFEAAPHPLVEKAIAAHEPAGFVFWNSNHASAQDLREVIRRYSKVAREKNQKHLLFSTDYEGGGLSYTVNGNMSIGIQRFRKGMTGLAHPSWLEHAMDQGFGTELCELHGEIMASELSSIGINYPLATVSDLQNPLFAMRSISKNPDKVSTCLRAMMKPIYENGHIVFVTKHFPGLGQTRGDTHNGTIVSHASSMSEESKHLKPFYELVDDSKLNGKTELLSILASHAKFPLFDPDHITTESPKILKDLIRKKMKFSGIVVSDAMWMGEYEKLSVSEMMPVYLNGFVSGLDILMIKGSHFGAAVQFFRQVYDNEVDAQLMQLCESRMGMTWEQIRANFIERLKESNQRIEHVHDLIGDAGISMSGPQISPRDLTAGPRARYNQILRALDPQWSNVLQRQGESIAPEVPGVQP